MTPKPHPCYCVFDPAGKILWYTVRRANDPRFPKGAAYSKGVHEAASGVCWATALRRGYTVRPMRLTERKGK